jgi:uncharacterized protein YgbK (DUF1537 family)
MTSIRILADDLTGALDTAAAFAGAVPVFIDAPPAGEAEATPAQVAVVATPTRDVPVADLAAHLKPVLVWFSRADVAFKKVDSLLRGNTFAELAWLLKNGEFTSTLFAPAFPAQGRVTSAGRQWVVDRQTGARTQAAAAFAEAFAALGVSVADATLSSTSAIRAPEVLADSDLDALAAELANTDAHGRLWCGSAGLGFALARALDLAPAGALPPVALPRAGSGPSLLVSASQHPVLREQWRVLKSTLAPQALCEDADDSALAAAVAALSAGAKSAWVNLSPAQKIGPEDAAKGLKAQMRRLVETAPRPAQLIIVGGDTLLCACRESGANSLVTAPALRSGWGCARLQGGVWDGVPCYSRSGAFGAADDLLTMIRLLDGGDGKDMQ